MKPDTNTYTYLASPYSHAEYEIREARYIEARRCLYHLLSKRIWTYSPIVHCHELAKHWQLPPNHEFWIDFDKAMLLPASRLLILTLPGWQDSLGIDKEVTVAFNAAIPIQFISPSTYTITGEGAPQ